MQHLNHVHRRGAVYVWRRRMPARSKGNQEFIQASLRTRDFSTAKILANLLNCKFSSSILKMKAQKITRAEAQQFLSAIVVSELARIENERYAEPQAITPNEWSNRYLDERARSAALLKVAAMGPAAHLFEEDRIELAQDGFDPACVVRVERHIAELIRSCDAQFEQETAGLAAVQLHRRDFTADDLRALSRIRLTGKARAMHRSDRRKQTTPFIDLEPMHPTTWCDCGGRSPVANEVWYIGLMDISREENDHEELCRTRCVSQRGFDLRC